MHSGKVRYLGSSTFAGWQVVEALWASEKLQLNRFVSEQPPYNLLDRRIERELLPVAQTFGLAVIPWSPIGGGLLSGKYLRGQPIPDDARYSPKNRASLGVRAGVGAGNNGRGSPASRFVDTHVSPFYEAQHGASLHRW